MDREILAKILELCNQGIKVSFTEDWGDGLTVHLDDAHTHVGYPGCTLDELHESLYDLLVNGRGLSLVRP